MRRNAGVSGCPVAWQDVQSRLLVIALTTAGTAYILSHREYTITGPTIHGQHASTGPPMGYGPDYGLEYRQDL